MRTRQKDRKRVEIPGQCQLAPGHSCAIAIRDLTEEGCRFAQPTPPIMPGSQVSITIGAAGPFRAYARWSAEGDVGVSFARPHTAEQLRAMVDAPHAPAAPRSAASLADVNAGSAAPATTLPPASHLPLRSVC